MPAVRIRCHGFARVLRQHGLAAEVFSYADDLGAKSGKEEQLMSAVDKLFLNIRAYQRLSEHPSIIVMQRCNYHSLAPVVLNVFNRYPIVFDLDDWEAREHIRYYYGRLANSGAVTAQRFIARRSRLCIGASRFLCDFLAEDNKNVVYAPTGVDAQLFMPPPLVRRDDADIVLSWIGTMHRPDNVENIRFLIECYRELRRERKDIRLEIAGDGCYGFQVREMIRHSDAAGIRAIPWMDPLRVPVYLSGVDIGIMPLIQNTCFNKAKSPTRLFEYMAMEKPVVASATGESALIIQDGVNGFLAADKKTFVGKIIELIKNKKLREDIGKNARVRILEQYTLELVAKKVVNAVSCL
jgi:glycosyltransferase involved in cell wall biosynthesis